MSKTVKRLSEELHITKQAIYQRMDAIDGFRDAYTTRIANRILVDAEGAELLKNFDRLDKFSQQTVKDKQAEQQQDANNSNQSELKLVMKQLDIKDKQLDEKDRQLERLQKSLDQQQQLQLATISENNNLKKQIKQLNRLETTDQENKETPPKKKNRWWKFWK